MKRDVEKLLSDSRRMVDGPARVIDEVRNETTEVVFAMHFLEFGALGTPIGKKPNGDLITVESIVKQLQNLSDQTQDMGLERLATGQRGAARAFFNASAEFFMAALQAGSLTGVAGGNAIAGTAGDYRKYCELNMKRGLRWLLRAQRADDESDRFI